MAKKKINILLIIIVLGLWGSVFYKTLNQYFFSKNESVVAIHSSAKIQLNQINKDTFVLQTIARDPFLNNVNREIVSPAPTPSANNSLAITRKVNKPIQAKPKEIMIWPSISYHGYIKDSQGELVIIKINQKMFRLRKEASIQGILIKKISSDSIEVDFNKEKKTIRRFKV